MRSLSLKDLSKIEMVVNVIILPIVVLTSIWFVYSNVSADSLAIKEIKQWSSIDVSLERADALLFEEAPDRTDRYYENLINYREQKIEKIKEWTSKEKVKDLLKYNTFYDWLISDIWEKDDFDTIANELTLLAEEAWVELTSITLRQPKPSRTLILKWENIIIYEKVISLKLVDKWYEKKWITSYDKLKRFLELIRNDIKTPYNTNIDIHRWKEIWEEVSFTKLSLIFFYKWEK